MPLELSRDARRWLGRAPEIANLALIVLIGLSAARLFWLAWPAPALPLAPAATGPGPGHGDGRGVDVDTIAGAYLFGKQAADPAAEQKKIIHAPETHLDLTLTGIISDSARRRSRALIKNAHDKQDSYAVGDTISKGVKLHAIYANRVILDRSGRFETLTLASIKQARALAKAARRPRRQAASARGRTVAKGLAADLGAVRRKILANPATASRYIRLQPARQNGSLVGYRIYPGADSALFKKAGLKPGELVTAINGQPLHNPAAAFKLLGHLAGASSANVTLRRGGRERTVTVNFQ